MGAIDSSSGRRFLAGFVTLAVISGITLGIAKVTTTLYALSLQATPLELALLGAAQSVGILAVSLPVGLMVDRYGARRLFVIGSLLVTVLYALIPAWGRLGFLLACTTAVSFAMPLRFISLSAVFMGELARIGEARAGWFRGAHMSGMFLIGPALAAGIGTSDVLEVATAISDRVPVILLAYAGLVVGGDGPDAFAERAVAAGVSGVVIPDLPLGTDESIRQALSAAGLAVIPLVAPTTSPERRSRILEVADGFVYLVSDVGTTGERGSLPPALPELVDTVSSEAPVPVAVGFGISSPEQAAEVGRVADGVIIGS